MKYRDFNSTELSRFSQVQQLAYACATEIAKTLQEGVTEKEVARQMNDYLRSRGVTHYLHEPYAWFGDRTAFSGLWTPFHFFPTHRRLREGMPVILDVGPVVKGYAADIGYSLAFGENPIQSQLMRDLAEFRKVILEGVLQGQTFQAIYKKVDQMIAESGYKNCHRQYPQSVLAHRVVYMEKNFLAKPTLGRFGVQQLQWLTQNTVQAWLDRKHESPLWNGGRYSDHPPAPGLWAVEPHLGFQGVGAKWEELLVITESTAYWLDDDLPHVRFWQSGKQ